MKKAIIFLHGDLADVSRMSKYADKEDFIICADGGVEHALALGCSPDVVIGDMDSISKESESKLKGEETKFIRFSRDKNESDGELAVDYAVDQGYTKIIIFGLLGRRIDHVIANLFLPMIFQDDGVDIRLIEGDQEIFIVREYAEIKGTIGDQISFIPIKGDAEGVTTKGLKFPLKNENLQFGYSRGLSNVFASPAVIISLKKGELLVVHNRK